MFQVNLESVQAARAQLKGVVRETPLLPSSQQDRLFLKAENLQLTGSFKIRPAYCQIAALSARDREKGIVTSSSGNFAQGVAYAARQLGVSAKVVMMRSSNPLKVERTRRLGAEVVSCEDRFEARNETVARIAETEGRATIHPYDHPRAIAGNGSIALEILEQFPGVEHIVVPISGGGLIAGISLAIKGLKSSVKVWGVQPAGSPATHLSFRKGVICSIERAQTVADGLKVTRPGNLTFPIIQRFVEDVLVVSEEMIIQAVLQLLIEERIVVEPSGAVTLAAVLEKKVPTQNTVLLLSGGNIAHDLLGRVVAGQLFG